MTQPQPLVEVGTSPGTTALVLASTRGRSAASTSVIPSPRQSPPPEYTRKRASSVSVPKSPSSPNKLHRRRSASRVRSLTPSPTHDTESPVIPYEREAARAPCPLKPILFYDRNEPYYGFTNFSPDAVRYNGKTYPTSEHLFQSFKFHEWRPFLAEHIRTFSQKPSVAFSEARRFKPEVRSDWMQINIAKMDITLYHKFTQNARLRQELLSTGDAHLIEASDIDAFWGWGPDHKGQNQLGKALVRLRDRLRREGA